MKRKMTPRRWNELALEDHLDAFQTSLGTLLEDGETLVRELESYGGQQAAARLKGYLLNTVQNFSEGFSTMYSMDELIEAVKEIRKGEEL